MALSELSRILASVPCSSLIKIEVLTGVLDVEETLKYKLRCDLQSIGPRINIEGFILKNHENKSEVESIIQESRIREAQRRKLELQSKLEAVEESLNLLNTNASPPPVEKPKTKNMQDSKIRHQVMEELTQKANEASEFARKLHHEQLTRKRRQQERELEQSKHIYEELKGYDYIKQRYEAIISEQKQKKRELLMGRAEARRAEMERRRVAEQQYKASMSPTPIYKVADNRLSFNMKQSELAQRKEELAAKRQFVEPTVQSLSPQLRALKYEKLTKVNSSLHIKNEPIALKEPKVLKRLAVFHGDAQVTMPVRTKQSVAHLKNSANPFEVPRSLYNPHIENVPLTDSSRQSSTDYKQNFKRNSKESERKTSKNSSILDNQSDSMSDLQLPQLMYGKRPLEALYDF